MTLVYTMMYKENISKMYLVRTIILPCKITSPYSLNFYAGSYFYIFFICLSLNHFLLTNL